MWAFGPVGRPAGQAVVSAGRTCRAGPTGLTLRFTAGGETQNKKTVAPLYPIRYFLNMYTLQKTNHFDRCLCKLRDLRAKAKILASPLKAD